MFEWLKHIIWERNFHETSVSIPPKKRSAKHPYEKKAAKKILEMGTTYCCHEANHAQRLKVRRVL